MVGAGFLLAFFFCSWGHIGSDCAYGQRDVWERGQKGQWQMAAAKATTTTVTTTTTVERRKKKSDAAKRLGEAAGWRFLWRFSGENDSQREKERDRGKGE